MKKILESIPSGWTEKRLKENSRFIRRGKSPVYSDENQGLVVINQDCIRWERIDFNKIKYNIVPNRIDADFFLRSDDILINSTGTGTIGRVNQWSYPDVHAVADSHITVLRVKEESLNAKYVRYFLSSESGQRYLESVCYTGSTNQIELSKRYLSRLSLPCPILSEQKTIAGILGQVDEAIETAENSIMAAERLNKSLMQNLLTGKLKPDGTWRGDDEFYVDEKVGKVPKGWTVKRLKEIFDINNEMLPSKTDQNFKFRYITIETVKTEIVDYDNCPEYYFKESPGRARRLVKSGDILISGVRPNLKAFAIYEPPNDENWICSTGFFVLSRKEKEDNKYHFYQILSSFVEAQFHSYVAGTNYPAIGDRDIRNIRLLRPSYDEQKIISEHLESVSNIISQKKSKIIILKTLKKSLMQNLLTGKVRLDVEKITNLL